jgi:hypothetical protein
MLRPFQMLTGIDSAVAKVIRATEHLDAINRLIDSLTSSANAYEIIKDADGKEVINFLVDPPPPVAVLAGEIIYQLRSALDHLTFDLVKLNPSGVPLPAGWERRCDFPLWLTIPGEQIRCGHATPPLPYNCFAKTLPGISKAAFSFIEGLQPYRTGQGHHNVMAIIAKLSNIDKHRHLNAILPRIAVRQDFKTARGLNSTSIVGGFRHGAEVQNVIMTRGSGEDPTVDMKRTFLQYVTFDEPAIGAGPASLEAQNVLEVCTETVKRVVIPEFIQLLKNP